jgi:cell division protein FtsL
MVSDKRPYNFSEMQSGEEAEAAPAAGENTAAEAAATNEQAQEVSPNNEQAKFRDPQYWVEKMSQLQSKINTLEEAITKNQEELNRMNTSFLHTDLPLQQQNVKMEINRLRQQIASDQQELDQAKQELADLPNQARKSGIAAGVLRQKSS